MRDLAEDQETRARALWDVNRLEAEYRETTLALSQSRRRLSRSSTEEAMVETFRVGGQAIRQLVLDPLLPQEMVDSHERSTLVKAMMEYDKFGRAFWAPFMQRHGVVRRGASAALPFETAAGIYPDVSQEAGAI
jgi:phenylacetic acid degradation operon negative regulatory protein